MGEQGPTAATRIVRNPAVLWRQTLDGVVVLGPEDEQPLVLAPPGDAVWAALAEPVDRAGLAEHLAAAYDAPGDVVRAHVERFVEQLLVRRLAVEVDGPG